MSRVEKAFQRLDRALSRLEEKITTQAAAAEAGVPSEVAAADAAHDQVLKAERDVLAAKVARLQARSAEEAQLRGEAAEAVRAALSDLRAMAAQAGQVGGMHG
ncbi:MAG: hypothetical protein AAFR17_17995 [Pseudomonadota bacterium]